MPRPRSVTLLALVVLSLAAYNALGAVGALRRYTLLDQLNLSLPPAYLIADSVVWAGLLAWLGVGLWHLKAWARRGTLAAVALYLVVSWVERLAFGRSEYTFVTAPCDVLVQIVALAFTWGTLLRRSVRATFSA